MTAYFCQNNWPQITRPHTACWSCNSWGRESAEADGQRCCWVWAALFSECKNSNQDTFEELCNHENGREILLFLLLSAVISLYVLRTKAGAAGL